MKKQKRIVIETINVTNLECLGGEVPGRQTVPRAELWGAIQTLACAHDTSPIELGIDAKYVTGGARACAELCGGANGDLWCILDDLIAARHSSTTRTPYTQR